jgi:hypothetical protein
VNFIRGAELLRERFELRRRTYERFVSSHDLPAPLQRWLTHEPAGEDETHVDRGSPEEVRDPA